MEEKGHNVLITAQAQFRFWPQDGSSVCVKFYTDPMNLCIYFQNVVSSLPKWPNWFMNNFMFKIVRSPQTIAWYSVTVIAPVNWTVQLDQQ